MGQPKQLIPFRGKSLVRRIIDGTCEAGCSPVVVVIRGDDEKLRHELGRAGVVTVENKQWQRGIGSSIRCGIAALTNSSPDVEASVLLVCDQPAVDAGVIERLIALRETTGEVSAHAVDSIPQAAFGGLPLLRGSEILAAHTAIPGR